MNDIRKTSPQTPNAFEAMWLDFERRLEKIQKQFEELKADIKRWRALRKTKP